MGRPGEFGNAAIPKRHGTSGLALVVALLCLALVLAPAAGAESHLEPNDASRGHTSPVVDALFLRPLGLVATIAGTAIFVVASPIFALTRPTQIAEPFNALVVAPARYTWVDPLGDHAVPSD